MLDGRNWPATADSSPWSRLEDKLFERALAVFSENTPDRWEKIASQVPGKTWTEVRRHYEDLVHDVSEIDSGRVQLPNYCDDDDDEDLVDLVGMSNCDGDQSGTSDQLLFASKGSREKETERRRGVPWTQEEHRLFLIGLERYGKGDWRSIARNAVVSRTPAQVASHAQKYFLRLNFH
ncbi:transcription factor DIVARICATA-like [Tripterygium wilfordii]|uniref:Transcription factor DIVARICATA-like n=1 Tax=Tripterygium wilfordii TaxID=458696 RepID=A0A7J7DEV6_TRIWF|nr:transcription factor DIVARICATA-like [Tripterygium wilfordii]